MADPTTDAGERRDVLLAVYAVVAERRTSLADLQWQVPSLSFAGQAFLLGLALNGGGSPLTRGVAGALSLIIAVIAIQLFLKHRYLELMDSRRLRSIERSLGVDAILGQLPHGEDHAERGDVRPGPLTRLRATQTWMVVQLALIGAAIFVIASAVLAPDLLRPQSPAG
ncbi:MAG TPA: hypothetical protein VOB72_10690 [Candidatus Dormibacteraeota bacterium]|nr:hypothetical protein [Candidatus Dormibacteraeota bacterium]